MLLTELCPAAELISGVQKLKWQGCGYNGGGGNYVNYVMLIMFSGGGSFNEHGIKHDSPSCKQGQASLKM